MQVRTKADAEKALGVKMSFTEWSRVSEAAVQKIARIILREGDANGERLKDWYFYEVVAEMLNADRFGEFTQKKTARLQPHGQQKREENDNIIVPRRFGNVKGERI